MIEQTASNSLHELSPQQAAFVQVWLIDGNGKQAAIRAGYSPRTAEAQASRLLRSVKVRTAIKHLRQETEQRLELTKDDAIKGLHGIATSDSANDSVKVTAWMSIARIMGWVIERQLIKGKIQHEHVTETMANLTDEQLDALIAQRDALEISTEGVIVPG